MLKDSAWQPNRKIGIEQRRRLAAALREVLILVITPSFHENNASASVSSVLSDKLGSIPRSKADASSLLSNEASNTCGLLKESIKRSLIEWARAGHSMPSLNCSHEDGILNILLLP